MIEYGKPGVVQRIKRGVLSGLLARSVPKPCRKCYKRVIPLL